VAGTSLKPAVATIWILLFAAGAIAQELQPRAYLPSPVGATFVGLSYSRNVGGLLFDPTVPVTDAHVVADVISLSAGQSLNVFGRSAQLLAVLPYVRADLTGTLAGAPQYRYRSGIPDPLLRFAMNIIGAPAMHRKDFVRFRQKTIIGASLSVTAPWSQYDPNLVLNLGTNRWAYKPELGISRAFRDRWLFEGAFGAWLYTANKQNYGNTTRTQDPLGSVQIHVVRVLPRRIWVAFDGTFYTGGRTYVNGAPGATYQANSRLGLTVGMVLDRRQAIRAAYFQGATTRVGSDIASTSVAYQVLALTGK